MGQGAAGTTGHLPLQQSGGSCLHAVLDKQGKWAHASTTLFWYLSRLRTNVTYNQCTLTPGPIIWLMICLGIMPPLFCQRYQMPAPTPHQCHNPSSIFCSTVKRIVRHPAGAVSSAVFPGRLAPSTQKTYQAAMHHFHKFCTTYNVSSPFPLSEQILCTYASYLADQHLAPQTIKSYLSALRNWQIPLGLPDLREKSSMPMLKRVKAGISRLRLQKGSPVRIRLTITAELLRRIKGALDTSSNLAKLVIWAVASTAIIGFFRLGKLLPESARAFNESVCLPWGDVVVDNRSAPRMLQIYLKKSKGDQLGAGANVIVRMTGDELYPVSAVVSYLELRGDEKGAFFLDLDGRTVIKSWFVEQIWSILSRIGVPQHHYAGHSFRIGAATTAALAGVEDSTIQALGR